MVCVSKPNIELLTRTSPKYELKSEQKNCVSETEHQTYRTFGSSSELQTSQTKKMTKTSNTEPGSFQAYLVVLSIVYFYAQLFYSQFYFLFFMIFKKKGQQQEESIYFRLIKRTLTKYQIYIYQQQQQTNLIAQNNGHAIVFWHYVI